MNFRSTRNKSVAFADFINSNKSDIIAISSDIDFKVQPQPCFNTFASISVHLSMGNAQDIIFHTVCRPHNVFKVKFIEDFSSLVEGAALSCRENIG